MVQIYQQDVLLSLVYFKITFAAQCFDTAGVLCARLKCALTALVLSSFLQAAHASVSGKVASQMQNQLTEGAMLRVTKEDVSICNGPLGLSQT